MAAGIMAIIALGVAQMMSNQSKDVKSLTEKIFAKDIELQMHNMFQNNDYCNCVFQGKTFDMTATPPTIVAADQITHLSTGFSAGPPACTANAANFIPTATSDFPGSYLKVGSIGLGPLTSVGLASYKAEVKVTLSNTIQIMKPISHTVQFSIDPTGGIGPNARPFVRCQDTQHTQNYDLLFGGAFGDPGASPAYVNPATGAFSCPAGYVKQTVLGKTGIDYFMSICFRKVDDVSAAFPAQYYAFGGMFSNPPGNHNNPYTGATTCPGGYLSQKIMGAVGKDYDLWFCYKSLGATPPNSTNSLPFAGFFSNGDHLATNPITGTSSCPAGYNEQSVYGWVGTDYDLFICWK